MCGARFTHAMVIALGVLCASCVEPDADGPPAIRAGHDACVECGMSIVDMGYAASALIDADGRRRHVVFDDMGCLLVWRAENDSTSGAHARVLEWWTMTVDRKEWIAADQASYVAQCGRRTPMASGIVGFASNEAARGCAAGEGGIVATFASLEIPENMKP